MWGGREEGVLSPQFLVLSVGNVGAAPCGCPCGLAGEMIRQQACCRGEKCFARYGGLNEGVILVVGRIVDGDNVLKRKKPPKLSKAFLLCGEGGIRTLGTN